MISTVLTLLMLAAIALLVINRVLSGSGRQQNFLLLWLVDLCRSLLPVLILVVLVRGFVVEPFRIPSGSMLPSLEVGDYILVNKNRYGIIEPLSGNPVYYRSSPQRGDIVVFFPPDDDRYFIKRLIGLPGDLITYSDKRLAINGQQVSQRLVETLASGYRVIEERLADHSYRVVHTVSAPPQSFVVRVRPGHYFMMGDNRDNSRDSRYWGQVPRHNLVGPTTLRWMHWLGWGHWPSFGTVGTVP